jgi:hypothetical protein
MTDLPFPASAPSVPDTTPSEPVPTMGEVPPPADISPAQSDAGVEDASGGRSDARSIDPDDTEAVPHALAGMVRSAREALRTMQSNPYYPAVTGVTAVEDTVAALARISLELFPYVNDYSEHGGWAMREVLEHLAQAGAALGDARHQLVLDDRATGAETETGYLLRNPGNAAALRRSISELGSSGSAGPSPLTG